MRGIIAAAGRPLAVGIPGYVVPTDAPADLFVKATQPIRSVAVSPADAMTLTQVAGPAGWARYRVTGSGWGRARVTRVPTCRPRATRQTGTTLQQRFQLRERQRATQPVNATTCRSRVLTDTKGSSADNRSTPFRGSLEFLAHASRVGSVIGGRALRPARG